MSFCILVVKVIKFFDHNQKSNFSMIYQSILCVFSGCPSAVHSIAASSSSPPPLIPHGKKKPHTHTYILKVSPRVSPGLSTSPHHPSPLFIIDHHHIIDRTIFSQLSMDSRSMSAAVIFLAPSFMGAGLALVRLTPLAPAPPRPPPMDT